MKNIKFQIWIPTVFCLIVVLLGIFGPWSKSLIPAIVFMPACFAMVAQSQRMILKRIRNLEKSSKMETDAGPA